MYTYIYIYIYIYIYPRVARFRPSVSGPLTGGIWRCARHRNCPRQPYDIYCADHECSHCPASASNKNTRPAHLLGLRSVVSLRDSDSFGGNLPLTNKNMPESNPLTSRILLRGLAGTVVWKNVWQCAKGGAAMRRSLFTHRQAVSGKGGRLGVSQGVGHPWSGETPLDVECLSPCLARGHVIATHY